MRLYVGAVAPESIEIILRDATFDFAAITSVDLQVIAPGGTRYVWSWDLDSTPGRLRLTHVSMSSARNSAVAARGESLAF